MPMLQETGSETEVGRPGLAGLVDAADVVARMDAASELWHTDAGMAAEDDLVLRLHRANFDLWHEEDRARAPHATDTEIATVKRRIDRLNQQRNDLTEMVDAALLRALREAGLPNADAPLNSETPGQMIDRLSVIALKVYHTSEETGRADATEQHRARNVERLRILREQQSDLASCLRVTWEEIVRGARNFKQYRQLKMYNDPELNPAVYGDRKAVLRRNG